MATQVASSPVRHGTCRWVQGRKVTLDLLTAGRSAILSITSKTKGGDVKQEYLVIPKKDARGLVGWAMIRTDTLDGDLDDVIGYDLPAAIDFCSCPDHQHRHCACKHMMALKAALTVIGFGE